MAAVTREQLEQLSREELIEVVLGQQRMIEQLQVMVVDLQSRVAELEEQVGEGSGPPKDSSNSSVPPSRSPKANRRRGKRGRKRAGRHPGTSRTQQEPDVILECRPTHCPSCGTSCPESDGGHLVGRSQVGEIPPIQPIVVEARRYQVSCSVCGATPVADYPAGMESQRVFGSRLEALVCYFHHRHHLSYERLQGVLGQVFGLSISQGALANILRRAGAQLVGQAERIRERVISSDVIGSDETGARVDGRNWWQWVFETPEAVYHYLAPTRSSAVLEEVLGEAEPEVWVSDCFSAQLKAPAQARQLCLAHQLRDLQYAVDAERCRFAFEMQQLFLRVYRLRARRQELPTELYTAQVADLEAACDALLSEPVQTANGERLRKRYRKHRKALFVCLHRQDVPPDNNASERALRNSVIHRKVSGGFRSEWGAQAHGVIVTVLQTAHKQGKALLATLASLLGPPMPLPPDPKPP